MTLCPTCRERLRPDDTACRDCAAVERFCAAFDAEAFVVRCERVTEAVRRVVGR